MTSATLKSGADVATISLNRPQRLNAINADLLSDLHQAFKNAHADDSRLIVLRGEGPSFCSGDDLQELAQKPPSLEEAEAFAETLQEITRLICFGPKHVVCAVHGWVVGGGIAWPLNADFTVWSDDTRLFSPEAGYGMFVSGGVTHFLPERCGREQADRIMLFGEKLSIDNLSAVGLAQIVAPRDELDTKVTEIAEQLLRLPPASLQRYKAVAAERLRDPLERALQAEKRALVSCAKDAGIVAAHLPEFASGRASS